MSQASEPFDLKSLLQYSTRYYIYLLLTSLYLLYVSQSTLAFSLLGYLMTKHFHASSKFWIGWAMIMGSCGYILFQRRISGTGEFWETAEGEGEGEKWERVKTFAAAWGLFSYLIEGLLKVIFWWRGEGEEPDVGNVKGEVAEEKC